jgi:hypothetical protein
MGTGKGPDLAAHRVVLHVGPAPRDASTKRRNDLQTPNVDEV